MAVPVVVIVAILYVAISLLIYLIGTVISASFGTQTQGLTNADLTSAGDTLVHDNTADCVASIDTSNIVQDEKVNLIARCYTDNLTNWWNDYQKVVYPDADHSALPQGIDQIGTCASIYWASAKTSADFAAFKTCSKTASDTAISKDKGETLKVYAPDAPATTKKKDTNYLLYIGAAAIGAYILGTYINNRKG